MHKKQRTYVLATLALFLLLAAGAIALASNSANFDLSWHVIGGGGGASTSAGYRVEGTIGQAVAGPPTGSSASFTLNSGFWYPEGGESLFLPVLLGN